MTAQLDTFEAGLLRALRAQVADAPAPRPVRRRRLALAGAVATTTAAAVLVVPGLGPEPAYSVIEGNAGEVEVEVNRLEDGSGLERALAEHGIRAQVTFLPDGGQCVPGRYVAVDRRMSISVGADSFEVTLPPGAVRADETLVIDASVVPLPHGVRAWVDANVTRGPVPPCVPL